MIDSALCIKNTSICIMTRKAKSSYPKIFLLPEENTQVMERELDL